MKRISLFLTDGQIREAKSLGKQMGAPWASVMRRALDFYFTALKEGGITPETMPELMDGRVSKSKLNSTRPRPPKEGVPTRKVRHPKLERWLHEGKT